MIAMWGTSTSLDGEALEKTRRPVESSRIQTLRLDISRLDSRVHCCMMERFVSFSK